MQEARSAVLVVEDDPQLRFLFDEAITSAGLKCVIASSGEQARDHVEVTPSWVALVTDIKLGEGAYGWEVASCARKVNPNVPVIYMSGDSANLRPSQGVARSMMLQKPFAPSRLLIALEELRGNSPSGVAP